MTALAAHGSLKLVVCGGSEVGKSAMIGRLCTGKFQDESSPTIGVVSQTIKYTAKRGEVMLTVWEVTGKPSRAQSFLRNVGGALILVEQGKALGPDMEALLGVILQHVPPECALICITKIDRRRKNKEMQDQLDHLSSRFKVRVTDVSSLTGHGIDDAFASVIDKAMDVAAEREAEQARQAKAAAAAAKENDATVSAAGEQARAPKSAPSSPVRHSGQARRTVPRNSMVREPVPFDDPSASPDARAGAADGAVPGGATRSVTGPDSPHGHDSRAPLHSTADTPADAHADAAASQGQGCMGKCVVM